MLFGNPCCSIMISVGCGKATERSVTPQVLGPGANQHDVYHAGVKDVVEDVLKGYNGTVMAYGQTGVLAWMVPSRRVHVVVASYREHQIAQLPFDLSAKMHSI